MSLPEPSEGWRRCTRGVVWAGVVTPVPFEAALSWRVRGPGALRRLRVLFRRDLRRRCVGGGCRMCTHIVSADVFCQQTVIRLGITAMQDTVILTLASIDIAVIAGKHAMTQVHI